MKLHLPGIAVLMAITLFTPGIAVAQGLTTRYVFASPSTPAGGAPPVAWGGGGGVEWWAGKNTNVGLELEGLFFPAYSVQRGPCCWESGNSWVGLLPSFNGKRYLARSTNGRRWKPFVTAGAGAIVALASQPTRFGAGPFAKVGGGVDRWLTPHRGVRFEMLAQLIPTGALSFRIGLIFR
jgi:hypothetical protein